MGLESISAATNPATATLEAKTTNKDSNSVSANLTDFLKLLTTQLQNQDPTAPADTNQITQQLIGFSQVEQQVNTNNKLDTLVNSQTTTALSTQLSASTNYIGKMVEIEGSAFNIQNTGEPKFSYDVPEGTANSVITISDSKGNVIGSFKGSTTVGKQNLVWDAKDANGNRLPSGAYDFRVTLVDSNNETTLAKTYVQGEVTSVLMDSGEAKLVVDDNTVVQVKDVIAVEDKQAATS